MPHRIVHHAKVHPWGFLVAVLIATAFLVASYSLWQAHQNGASARQTICRANNNTRKAFRDVLDLAVNEAKKLPKSDPRRQRAIRFYEHTKRLVPNVPCHQL